MWQTVLVFLVLLGVSIYLVRHYVRVYRAEGSTCSGCSGCCTSAAAESNDPERDKTTSENPTCQDMKKHEDEADY